MEKELGHTILSSRYDETIVEHTNDAELTTSLNPDAECIYAYTQNQYQKAASFGVDLSEIKKDISAARNEPHDLNDLREILKSHGVDLIRGNNQGILVLEKDGEPLCPLHKAGAFHKDEMTAYMADFEKGNLNEDIIKSSEELNYKRRNEEAEIFDATPRHDCEVVNEAEKTKAEIQALKEQKQKEKQLKVLMNKMPISVQKTLQMTTEMWEALASAENKEILNDEITPIETLIESVEEQGKTITALVHVIKLQNVQIQEISKALNDLISELNYLRE